MTKPDQDRPDAKREHPTKDIFARFPFLGTLGTVEQFDTGDAILVEGEPGDRLFVIESGSVEISVGSIRLDLLGRGEVIGEMAMFDGSPRSAAATATRPTKVVMIDAETFLALSQSNTDFFRFIIQGVSLRLRRLNQKVASLMRTGAADAKGRGLSAS